jgi:hypothetical protein
MQTIMLHDHATAVAVLSGSLAVSELTVRAAQEACTIFLADAL